MPDSSLYQSRPLIGAFLIAARALLVAVTPVGVAPAGSLVQTPYQEQKVVFDFYFDEPQKIGAALYWVRALLNPLVEEPYGYAPEFLEVVVVIHGTEIVTTAKHHYDRYREEVERMKYYASLGVKFRVCGLAAADYGYSAKDFYDFIEIVPSAVTELAHWQLQGHALITPQVLSKRLSIEEIR